MALMAERAGGLCTEHVLYPTPPLQVDQRVLKDFMLEKMPRLMAHLEEHSVDVSLITFNWFLVVFVESLASDILLRVWDAFLYEGTKVGSTCVGKVHIQLPSLCEDNRA